MKNLNELPKADDIEARLVPVETPKADPEHQQDHSENEPCLLAKSQSDEFRSRWTTIQSSFVDEPRRAVKDADALILAATKQLSDAFAVQRSRLEKQWSQGEEVSTEDLRLALQQYRTFFSRLLSL
jgi:hypothetical protein